MLPTKHVLGPSPRTTKPSFWVKHWILRKRNTETIVLVPPSVVLLARHLNIFVFCCLTCTKCSCWGGWRGLWGDGGVTARSTAWCLRCNCLGWAEGRGESSRVPGGAALCPVASLCLDGHTPCCSPAAAVPGLCVGGEVSSLPSPCLGRFFEQSARAPAPGLAFTGLWPHVADELFRGSC